MNKLKTILLSTLASLALASCGPKTPVHTHVYDEGVVTKAATCTEDGVKTFTCECGDTKEEAIPATGHNYVAKTTEPTCTEDGKVEYVCECGDVDESRTEVIPATGHDYTEVEHTVATLDTPAYDTYTCHCGDYEIRNEDAWTSRSIIQAFADEVFEDSSNSVRGATLNDGTEVRYTAANFADRLGAPAEAIELVTSVIFDELEGLDAYQGATDDGEGGYYALYTYESDYTFLAVEVDSYLNSTNTIIQVMSYVIEAV